MELQQKQRIDNDTKEKEKQQQINDAKEKDKERRDRDRRSRHSQHGDGHHSRTSGSGRVSRSRRTTAFPQQPVMVQMPDGTLAPAPIIQPMMQLPNGQLVPVPQDSDQGAKGIGAAPETTEGEAGQITIWSLAMKYGHPLDTVFCFTASKDIQKLGFSVSQCEWPMIVSNVVEGGWAQGAGMKEGDEVLAFNNKDIKVVANGADGAPSG